MFSTLSMYNKSKNEKSNSAHCMSRELVHTKVCGVLFLFCFCFCYTSIKSKKSKINPSGLIKDKR